MDSEALRNSNCNAKVRDRADVAAEEKIASPHRSCRSGRGGPRASTRCCRFSICAGYRPATSEALTALLGKDAPNLSPAVITRLTAQWQADYDAWQKRDLSARRYVYVWADGVYLQAGMG